MLDEKVINKAAEEMYGQFISSKPHRSSFLGGVHVGAVWAEHELQLTWTSERPTVPGWYWVRSERGTFVRQYYGASDFFAPWDEFAGPIPEPAESAKGGGGG